MPTPLRLSSSSTSREAELQIHARLLILRISQGADELVVDDLDGDEPVVLLLVMLQHAYNSLHAAVLNQISRQVQPLELFGEVEALQMSDRIVVHAAGFEVEHFDNRAAQIHAQGAHGSRAHERILRKIELRQDRQSGYDVLEQLRAPLRVEQVAAEVEHGDPLLDVFQCAQLILERGDIIPAELFAVESKVELILWIAPGVLVE
mmetsp:Transcript_30687/g.70987  ORF Transcript_30687/g.70987 Transcript_30687/m.70987 type:complete len:205 (+) Transcript_30687:139-753(+)